VGCPGTSLMFYRVRSGRVYVVTSVLFFIMVHLVSLQFLRFLLILLQVMRLPLFATASFLKQRS
jgi:hypothetical protein